ncbi:MAG: DUF4382 domain-containing protein [Deltaproteobacteria bacterium]|nr:DUF4382 domain-containing protein [Deltaproteobacteria bacterium]
MKFSFAIGIMMLAAIFTGCGPGDGGSGTLHVMATDAPFPYSTVASATVTLTKVEARLKDLSGPDASYITLSETSETIDLVQLTNGLALDIASLTVPTGDYDQVRLIVTGGTVTMTDGRFYDLKVPSGSETGIKVDITPAIHVESSLSSDLLLDFNLAKSFVAQGGGHTADGISGFHFNPVIRAANMTTAGTISGIISAGSALAGAVVTVSQAGVEVAEAVTDAYGRYTIIGLLAGGYDISVSRTGFNDLAANGVAVVAGNVTTENLVMSGTVNATVTAAASANAGLDGLQGAPEHIQLQKGYSRPGGGTSSPLLVYKNGTVLHAQKTMAIFWGTEWATYAGDKITGIDTFFSGMGGSEYGSTGDEYFDTINGVSTVITSDSTYQGHTIDVTAAPTKALTTSSAVAEACKMVGNAPDASALYLIYTSTGAGHVNYCAWHSWGTCSNGAPIQVAYMPNIDGIAGCDPQDATSGHSQGLAALANVTAHEYMETVTDPRGAGWVDSSGNENGDKCAWSFPGTNNGISTLANGSIWKLQMEWSNAAYTAGTGSLNRSGQPGCIF